MCTVGTRGNRVLLRGETLQSWIFRARRSCRHTRRHETETPRVYRARVMTTDFDGADRADPP